MNKQFHKRPESSSRKPRPITGQIPLQNQKQAEQCFQMGKRHMMKREYNEALKHYNNALIHNPKDTKSLCNMGIVYKQLSQFQQSYDCYMQALNINGDDYIATYNLANLERIRSNYENANALYLRVLKLKQKGIKLGTLDYDSLINRSICLEKLDDFDGAIESCNLAVKLNPNDESAYFNKAMNLMKKVYQSSRSQFNNVTNSLCEQASQLLQKILKMKPNLSRCKVALVELKFLCNISKSNLEATKKSFEELMKNDSNIGTHEVQIKLKLFDSILNINNKLANSKRLQPPPARPIINHKKKEPKPAKPANIVSKPINIQEPEIKKQNLIGIRKLSQEMTTKQLQEKQDKLEQNLAQKQQGEKVKRIRELLGQKKYSQAFIQARNLDDKLQKYELQIEINLLEIQQNSEASNNYKFQLLQTALQIYNTKIKKDSDAAITRKTCTERGHEIMATLLNIAQSYLQASKHYEVLLQIVDDKKEELLSSEKKKDIHAGLGACYSETGRVKEAIQEYQNSLKIQPNNYFLMTNLCGLLIRDNRQKQAKQIYKNFLDQNGGKGMQNKTHYIDSLVNISICEKETHQEEKAVELAIKEMQQYYPTYEDIKSNLDQEAILNLYLRWIDILEVRAGQFDLSQQETQKLNEQLLDSYLSCLQFQNCPDRQAISINSGIIFYLNKFYTNALAFFRTITYAPNKKLLANNIGLTMVHLHEHEKAYSSFSLAVEENPANIIYNTNFEIMKWIYGVSEMSFEKYNCKCEAMFGNRVNFGIYMFDRLTNMIVKNKVKSQNQPGSNQTVQSIVVNLINQLMSPIQQTQNSLQAIKFYLLAKLFYQHAKECNLNNNRFINQSIVTKYLKVCGSDTQIEAGLTDISGFVSGLPKSSPKVTLYKGLINVFLAANSKKLGEEKVSGCWQKFKKCKSGLFCSQKIESLTVLHVDMKQAFQNIQHNRKVKSKITHPSLSFRMVENIVRDAECVFENSLQFVISKIQQAYYSIPDSLISPFELSYTHPHCTNVATCNECLIRYVQIYSSVFGKKIKYPLQISSQENTNQFFRQIQIFSKQCYQEGNPIFLKEEKEIEVKLSTKVLPFKLITHHKTIEGVRDFLKLLNNSFILNASDSKKGVQTLQLGKSLILQLWWGDVSLEDKIWHELHTKQNMITHSHVLVNSYIDNLIEMSQECQNGKEPLGSVIGNVFNGK